MSKEHTNFVTILFFSQVLTRRVDLSTKIIHLQQKPTYFFTYKINRLPEYLSFGPTRQCCVQFPIQEPVGYPWLFWDVCIVSNNIEHPLKLNQVPKEDFQPLWICNDDLHLQHLALIGLILQSRRWRLEEVNQPPAEELTPR